MGKKTVIRFLCVWALLQNAMAQNGNTITDSKALHLPFSIEGISTCGAGNDYTKYGNEEAYAGGEDLVYSFVSPETGKMKVACNGGAYTALYITTGDPAVKTNIVSYGLNGNNAENEVWVDVVAGKQYYIIIDNWPSPACNSNLKLSATFPSPFAPIPNNQDCLGAIPVCNSTFSNPTAYSGTGNVPNEIDPGPSCLSSGEKNDVWYQFTVQSTGKLCFCIDPVDNANDYDWALFNLTTANCSDIFTDPSLEVACNYSSALSWAGGAPPSWVTSASTVGNTGLFPAGSGFETYSQTGACIDVNGGESYALNVSNFSSTASGYTLYFPPPASAGMAQIYDNVAPVLQTFTSTPSCGTTTLDFKFSENILCGTIGSTDFTLTGPGGPYTVIAVAGAGCTAGVSGENTFTATVTPAISMSGNYQFCLVNTAGSISDLCGNVALVKCLDFTITGPTVSATGVNVACSGGTTGSVTAVASGGSGAPYTFSLNGGVYQASGTFAALSAGTYTITAKDANGCTNQTTVTVTQPAALTVSATATNTTCTGNNGAIATTVSGGTSAYSYSWAPSGSGANPTGLSNATYTLVVTDAHGCTANTTATVGVTGSVTSTFTGATNACLNANSFNFVNTGSTGAGTSYSWTFNPTAGAPGSSISENYNSASFTAVGTYTVTHTVTEGVCTSTTTQNVTLYENPSTPTVTTSNATCTNSDGMIRFTAPLGAGHQYSIGGAYQNGVAFPGIPAGTYTISVQNSNGCITSTTATVNQTSVPTAVSITTVNSTCGASNGSLTIGAVTGGVAAYTYSLNGLPYSSGTSYTGLSATTHTVTVKDANNCTYAQTTILADTPGPTALASTTTNATCGNSNGTASLGAVTGGTAPFTYSFNAGAYSSTTTYTSLAPGSYNAIVKDANNCTYTTSITVASSPSPTDVALTNGNTTCGNVNGTVTIGAVTSGTSPFTYSLNGGAFSTTTNYSALTASTHTVVVRDANNCDYTETFTLINIPGPTAVASSTTNAVCGGSNGTLTIGAVTGGTTPYTYSVNGGSFSSTLNYTGLAAGTYTIEVKDANNCTFSTTTAISNSGGPTAATVTSTNSICSANTGTVTVTSVTAGTSPYTYAIDGGAYIAGTTFTAVSAGVHTVVVKDNNGCLFGTSVTVGLTPNPTAIAVTTSNSTCGNANGTVSIISVTGGSSPYLYSVNGSVYTTTSSYSALAPATTHIVGAMDANGCVYTATFTIADTPGPTAVATTSGNSTCGNANGTISIGAVTGGTAPFTYAIDGGAYSASTSLSGLTASTHTLVVKDANACLYSSTVVVANTTGPIDFAHTPTQTNCSPGTGTITITAVTGGASPYTYSYDNGATYTASATGSNLTAGTYTVFVKDANGCAYSETEIITMVSGPTDLSFTTTNSTCALSNGSISATASGGAAPYVYSLNGGATQASGTFTGLTGTTYTITVTDNKGCTYSETSTLTNISTAIPTIAAKSDVKCNGGSDGDFALSMSGGSTPFTFTISPGGTSNGTGAFNGLSLGTYTVAITDGAGCQTSTTVTINQPTLLVLPVPVAVNVSCYGGSNGSITASASGGSLPYLYSVNGSPFASPASFTGLATGTYVIRVRDNGGCDASQTINITQPPILSASVAAITSANCTSSNGSATASVTGGTPGYSYSWSGGGGNSSSTVGIPTGNYTVTVTDSKGCTATAVANVGLITGGTAVMSYIKNITCNGANDGALTVSMGGNASAPFTYSWSPNLGSTGSLSNLGPGNYVVTVTDRYGCISSVNTSLAEPLPVTVTVTSNNVSCYGGRDGSITASASGGTGSLHYLWTPGLFTTATINNLPVGTYVVTVTDDNGCVASTSRIIAEPPSLTITPTVVNPHCAQADGSMTLAGGGGTQPYTFSLNGGAFQTSTTFSALAAGTYTVTIKDANQCTQTYPIQLIDQTGPTVSLVSKTDVKCYGGSTGSITVSASGGTVPYTYAWNTTPVQTTPTATNLPKGIYSVNITDASGCVASIGATINEPTPLTLNTLSTNPICNGQNSGTAVASAFGGTAPYSYSWSTSPAQTTANATGLVSGPYNVLVTDGNGCTKVAGVNIIDPPQMTLNTTSTNLTCYNQCNGTATVTVNNGTSPFVYSWNDPNNQSTATASGLCAALYTINVKDYLGCTASTTVSLTQPLLLTSSVSSQTNVDCNGNCNGSAQLSAAGGTPPYAYTWSNSFTGAVQSGLCAGTYSVTIKDANGCTSYQTVNIIQPGSLAMSVSSVDATCYNACDGKATANFTGGTPPYNFLWQPSLGSSFAATGLCAGTHTVTLTDSKGCVITGSATIHQPNSLTATTSTSPSNCLQSNGSACVQVTGGTSPFIYLWSNGATTACNNNINGNVYTVSVTDAKGCVIQAAANVNDISGATITLGTVTQITCYGLNNGSASISVAGGTLPYSSTTWLLPNLNPNLIQNGTSLHPGNNSVKVVDAAGCVTTLTVPITEPPQLVTAMNNVKNVTCNPANGYSCNGTATLLTSGGTLPYSYIWAGTSNQTAPTAVTLCAGSYTCTVTDAKGCTSSKPVTITQPLPLVIVTNNVTNVNCYGYHNGQINTSPTGGTPPFTYTWSPNVGTSPVVTNLVPQLYNLILTDANGCVASGAYNIQQPDSFKVNTTNQPSTCSNANGSLGVSVTGGTPAYTYHWNDPGAQSTAIATNLAAPAPYTCIITDSKGCTKSVTINLVNKPGPTIDSTVAINVTCHGFNNGSASVFPKSGTGPFTFAWTNATGTPVGSGINVSGLVAGTYNVAVTDANNCKVNGSVNVTEPQLLTVVTSSNANACNGQILGIYAAAGGGTPPYTYTWSGNGPVITGGGNHNVTFTNPSATTGAVYTYSVSVTDAKNCPALSTQFNINVSPKILPVVTNPTYGCSAQFLDLIASASGGKGAPYQFLWSNGQSGSGTKDTITVLVGTSLPSTYTVTISDGCSTPEDTVIKVLIHPKPVADMLTLDKVGCSPLTVSFAGSEGGPTFAGSHFYWEFGDGSKDTIKTPSHMYINNSLKNDTFDVQLIVVSPQGCRDTILNKDYIVVYPKPRAIFSTTPDTTTILYQEIAMINESKGAIAYYWNFGDPAQSTNSSIEKNPKFYYEAEGVYRITLTAVSSQACIDTVSHTIAVISDYIVYVPNAFTPNTDGKNEMFLPASIGVDISRYTMSVYNRWGELIFESNKLDLGWDGRLKNGADAPEGYYIWKIIVADKLDNLYLVRGNVTLIR